MNISRTDEALPQYDIILSATVYHPNTEVVNVMFDVENVIEIESGNFETKATLALPQLNYTNVEEQSNFGDESTHCLSFNGTIADLADTIPYIELYGHIDYESTPTNGHQYQERFTFPKIFLRNANVSLEMVSTSLDFTHGNVLVQNEEALFSASMKNIFNFEDNTNLTISFQLSSALVSILSSEIMDVG